MSAGGTSATPAAADAGAADAERAQIQDLYARRDGPGLIRFVPSVIVMLLAAWAAARLGAAGHPAAWLAAALCGLAQTTLFPAMHEAGHGTAFATPWLNRFVTGAGAFVMLQAPTLFREFHFEHHRSTGHATDDPEIGGRPELTVAWPTNPLHYLLRTSGMMVMAGKILFTLVGALPMTDAMWQRTLPYVRPSLRSKVAWESRAVIALYGLLVWAGVSFVDGFAYVLAAWPLAHVALGIYLLPEHTGLPDRGSQYERTRTVYTNAAMRFWMWNMPYHAEHHAHPAVPFHAVPELNRRVADRLVHTAPGYVAFHRAALGRAFGRERGSV